MIMEMSAREVGGAGRMLPVVSEAVRVGKAGGHAVRTAIS